MSLYFFDTSALIKRYVAEIGSLWAQSIITPAAGHIIVIAELAKVEAAATLARRRRENTLPPAAVSMIYTTFLLHVRREYLMVLQDSALFDRAALLADKQTLRSLDSIQLASAIFAQLALQEPVTFVCADHRLLAIAATEGLATDNPLNHP